MIANRHLNDARYVDIVAAEAIPLAKSFFRHLESTGETFFLMDQIGRRLDGFLDETANAGGAQGAALRRLLRGCQEIILWNKYAYALLRPRIAVKRIVRLHADESRFEEVSRFHYLQVKDMYVQGPQAASQRGLVLDFRPYFRDYPKVKEPASLGRGISILNRHLSGQMHQSPQVFRRALVEFLQDCSVDGATILANDHVNRAEKLLEELEAALAMLADRDGATPYETIAHDLRVLGFEAGWGRTAEAIAKNLQGLARVLESPAPEMVEEFLGGLPLIKTVLMVSPHGWFAQEDVLGKPDTGGQVTYVLDQARALERRMARTFYEAGIDAAPKVIILTRLIPDAQGTTCDQPREKVHGSENCWIVRTPFRDGDGQPVSHWISRFQIWPYLETFSEDSAPVILSELRGKPDLIVGHYSDGNLVAHRLAEDLGAIHCAAVHALEKTKYLFSDMRWADMEREYRFSLHFTADIVSYNSADFIISSSYREIGGTETEMGMFESYETFSMPGLYRVTSGMDPQLGRYNIVPPGCSEEYFFPFTERERRSLPVLEPLREALTGAEPRPGDVGVLADPGLPPIFAMSRLDKVKNLPGLVEAFGKSASLRDSANLVILSSLTDAAASADQEEIATIHRLHELVDHYGLYGSFRWVGMRLDKTQTGEVYRVIADHRGAFAQPAFMETFGLTVIEAMACGLPVAVTCFGGPAEIVQHEINGAVVDPNDHEAYAAALEAIVTDNAIWERYSEAGIRRVHEAYNWPRHAREILGLANVYGYWNYLDVMNRSALDQYIHTLYHTVYRPRAQAMLNG